MKKLRNVICFVFLILSSVIISACKISTDNVQVAFDILKTIVEKDEDITTWNGLNVRVLNKHKNVISTFKSNKSNASNEGTIDFIFEKGNYKVYCDDSVRYYYEEARKYIDESEFDYDEYEQDLLSESLNEVDNFFKNNKNSANLLNSSKLDKEDNIEYTFEIMLDKATNRKLVATYICDKHNKLIMIKIIISSDTQDKIETEITENLENVNTPEWFESDDYKTNLTYEEVKAIVSNDNLLNGWDNAEWYLPVGYSADMEDKIVVSSKTQGFTYTETESTKEYFDGDNLFKYIDGTPSVESLTEDKKIQYTFDYKCQEFKTFAYNYFFHNETVYKDYYVASKKYEKDLTIISYKYFGELNDVRFESICSLIYDIDNNLYEIRCYAKQESEEHGSFELNLYLKKLDSVSVPDWFDESDYMSTITFDYIWGDVNTTTIFDTSLKSKKVLKNNTVAELPDVITVFDTYFLGWYIEDTDTLVDSNYVITEDISLVPKFSCESIGVIEIISGSMEPSLKLGENYFYISQDDYCVDDIVVMCIRDIYLAHRIIEINENDGIKYYVTKADNSETIDSPCTIDKLVGKVISKIEDIDIYVPNFTQNATLSYMEVRNIFSDENMFNGFDGIDIFMPPMLNGNSGLYASIKAMRLENGEMLIAFEEEEGKNFWCDGTYEYQYKDGVPYQKISNKEYFTWQSTFDEFLHYIQEFSGMPYITKGYLFDCEFDAYRVVEGDFTTIKIIISKDNFHLEYTLKYENGLLFEMSLTQTLDDKVETARNIKITSLDAPEWFNAEDFADLEEKYSWMFNYYNGSSHETYETYQHIYVPVPELRCNGNNVEYESYYWEVIADDGLDFEIDQTGFTPFDVGTYELKFTVIFENGKTTSVTWPHKVVDTLPPIISVNNSVIIPNEIFWNPNSQGVMEVTFPTAFAYDQNSNIDCEVIISIRTPNGAVYNITYDKNNLTFTFNVTIKGSHEVRYRAIDENGNACSEIVYNFYVIASNDD